MSMKRGKMNKKGAGRNFWILVSIISIVLIVILIIISYFPEILFIRPTEPVWLDDKPPAITWDSPLGWALKYIFGITSETAQSTSALIVLFIVWGIFFVFISDMINKFGFLSETWMAWLIGFGIAVILANFGFMFNLLINVMAIFSFAAAFSVIVALASIVVAMLAVYLGLSSLGGWVMKRKAMEHATQAEAGGEELAGTIKGLKAAGKALRSK